MTYPSHYYLAFGGTAYSGEEWQCGIRLAGGEVGVELGDDMAAALNDVQADVKKFVQSGGAIFCAGYKLTYCKFNKINGAGHYADPGQSWTHIYAPAVSGSSTVQQPPQIACVVTLLTDAEFGAGSKGRFYWLGAGFPGITTGTTNYSMNVTARDGLAASAATLMADLANWPGLDTTGLAPAVVSGKGSGSWRPVTGVRVDDQFDTQRRRARSMQRTYKTVTV